MPEITVTLDALPRELREAARADGAALKRALLRTIEFDAPRWIQWSIKGAGGGGGPGWKRTVAPGEAPAPPPPKKRVPKPKKLKKLGGKAKKKRVKEKDAGCQWGKRAAPAYREPVDTGDYKNSWKGEMLSDNEAIFYSSPNPPIKAGVIELGRRPGRGIPIEPLAEWVRRKFRCQSVKHARAIATGISFRAMKYGRPGLHVLARAHPKIAESLLANIAFELARAAGGNVP